MAGHRADTPRTMTAQGHHPLAVANEMLDLGADLGLHLTNISLQKPLYFTHAWQLVAQGAARAGWLPGLGPRPGESCRVSSLQVDGRSPDHWARPCGLA